jgi:antitoxin HicB
MFDYPVTLTPDDNGTILVTFPDVPEAITFGADENEALLYAVEALETALSFYMDDRKPLPIASVHPGLPTVTPETLSCAKLGLYQAMLDSGIRKADLARRLNIAPTLVDRLLSLEHSSKIEQIDTALAALGKRLVVDIRVAA